MNGYVVSDGPHADVRGKGEELPSKKVRKYSGSKRHPGSDPDAWTHLYTRKDR